MKKKMNKITACLPLMAIIYLANLRSISGLPVPEDDVDKMPKLIGSSVVTSVSVVTSRGENGKRVVEKISDRKRVIPVSDLPASPAALLRPDRIQFYTFNQKGDVVTKQMTEKEIQSLIAAGGGHLPLEIHEPQKTDDVPAGGMKVADVVQNVQNVLKSELNKPTPVMTSIPTIPGHANSDWSSILPSILSGDMETVPSSDPGSIYMSEMPEIIETYSPIIKPNTQNYNGLSSTDQEMDEKPMIQIPVITVDQEQPSHLPVSLPQEEKEENDSPIYQMVNTLSADKLKVQVPTHTIINLSNNQFGQDQTTGASQVINHSTNKPEISSNESIKIQLENKKPQENKDDTVIAVVAETHSTSIKLPGHDEIKIHETPQTNHDSLKPSLIESNINKLPIVSKKPNQTEKYSGEKKPEITKPIAVIVEKPEIYKPIPVMHDKDKPSIKPVTAKPIQENKKKPEITKPIIPVNNEKIKPSIKPESNRPAQNNKKKPEISKPISVSNEKEKPLIKPVLLNNVLENLEPTKANTEKLTTTTAATTTKTTTTTTAKTTTTTTAKTTTTTTTAATTSQVNNKLENLEQTTTQSFITDSIMTLKDTNVSRQPIISSTTEKAELKNTTISQTTSNPIPITTLKIEVQPTKSVSIETPTTTFASVISSSEPAIFEVKLKKPIDVITTEKSNVIQTTHAINVAEEKKTVTDIKIEEVSTEKELISSTDAPPTNEQSSDSIKKPMEPLSTDLANSLSSMISQITEVHPSMLPPLEEEKPITKSPVNETKEKANADITTLKSEVQTEKYIDKIEEKVTTITEASIENSSKLVTEFNTTGNLTVVKSGVNDQAEKNITHSIEMTNNNQENSTLKEDPTAKPTILSDAPVTEKISTEIIKNILESSTTSSLDDQNKKEVMDNNDKLVAITTEMPVIKEEIEAPIVRIDIMEAKPDTIKKLNSSEIIKEATESPFVRIQLTDSVTILNQMLEASPVVNSTPAIETLSFPTNATVGPNHIASGLIAGFLNDSKITDEKSTIGGEQESKENVDIVLENTSNNSVTEKIEEKSTIVENLGKIDITTEQSQTTEYTTELSNQKTEFDQLSTVSESEKNIITTTTPVVDSQKEKNKTDISSGKVTNETLISTTQSIIEDITTMLPEKNKNDGNNTVLISTIQSPLTSTESTTLKLKNEEVTKKIETTTSKDLETIEKILSTKTESNVSSSNITKPSKSDAPVVRIDTSPEKLSHTDVKPEVPSNELPLTIKPTAPKKTEEDNTPLVPNEEIRIQVNQTAVKVTKRPVIELSPSNIKEVNKTELAYENISYQKLGETSTTVPANIKANQTIVNVTLGDKKPIKVTPSDIQTKTKDQKKDSSLELMEKIPTVSPNHISSNSKPSLLTKDDQSLKPEKNESTKSDEVPAIAEKKNDVLKSSSETEKWKLIPQPGNNGKPVESGTEQESKKPTDPMAPHVPLDHPVSVEGLDSSVKNLESKHSSFVNLCNNLAFTMWTSINTGLNNARSLTMSPFGMTSMLGMIFLGARGSTSNQMNDILKLDDVESFNPHIDFQNVTDSVGLARKKGIANAAFVRELFSDRKLMTFYKKQAQQFYEGVVAEVNFAASSDPIRQQTNLMMRKQTGGRIKNFFRGNSVPLRGPLAALSANVFQTDCNYSYASSEGRDGELYFAISPAVRQRKLVPLPATVWKAGVFAGYEPGLDATAISLGGPDKIISTIFVIPGQQGFTAHGDNLELLEERLVTGASHDGAWNKLLKVITPRPGLELQLPKFSHTSIINATAALKKMGLHQLFEKRANLKGINSGGSDLHLSDVLQMNIFSTCSDENIFSGRHHHVETYPESPQRNFRSSDSKAKHETDDYEKIRTFDGPSENDGNLGRSARQPDDSEKPRLKLDRPFLYFVRHNPTGFILHMGRFNPRLP